MKLDKYLLLTVALLVSGNLSAQRLVILHTNDTHSQMDPHTSGRNAGTGGVERRAAYIAQMRAQYPTNLLLIDAGDYNQGTPYFNLFNGDLEVELMNVMGYEVATLGNHEFDNGQKELARRLKGAKYVTLCANYDFKKTPLKRLVKPYTIIERGGLKIGIIGLTVSLKGMVAGSAIEGLVFQNPVTVANSLAAMLKKDKKCDLVICLSHLGYNGGSAMYPSDIYVAEHSRNIDLIIGGHTHTFLEDADVRNDLDGKKVPIVQTGAKGVYVGRIDIY